MNFQINVGSFTVIEGFAINDIEELLEWVEKVPDATLQMVYYKTIMSSVFALRQISTANIFLKHMIKLLNAEATRDQAIELVRILSEELGITCIPKSINYVLEWCQKEMEFVLVRGKPKTTVSMKAGSIEDARFDSVTKSASSMSTTITFQMVVAISQHIGKSELWGNSRVNKINRTDISKPKLEGMSDEKIVDIFMRTIKPVYSDVESDSIKDEETDSIKDEKMNKTNRTDKNKPKLEDMGDEKIVDISMQTIKPVYSDVESDSIKDEKMKIEEREMIDSRCSIWMLGKFLKSDWYRTDSMGVGVCTFQRYKKDVLALDFKHSPSFYDQYVKNLASMEKNKYAVSIVGVDEGEKLVFVDMVNLCFLSSVSHLFFISSYKRGFEDGSHAMFFSHDFRKIVRDCIRIIIEAARVQVYGKLLLSTMGYDPKTKKLKLVDWRGIGCSVESMLNDLVDILDNVLRIHSINRDTHYELFSFMDTLKRTKDGDLKRLASHPALKTDDEWLHFLKAILKAHYEQEQDKDNVRVYSTDTSPSFNLRDFESSRTTLMSSWRAHNRCFLHFFSFIARDEGLTGKKRLHKPASMGKDTILNQLQLIKISTNHMGEHMKKLPQIKHLFQGDLFSPLAGKSELDTYNSVELGLCYRIIAPELAAFLYDNIEWSAQEFHKLHEIEANL